MDTSPATGEEVSKSHPNSCAKSPRSARASSPMTSKCTTGRGVPGIVCSRHRRGPAQR
ncbi:hypothetical protein GTR00_04720 [Kineococcus sp. T90]|nr:hypothetical protein [Kineococcus indalonis]